MSIKNYKPLVEEIINQLGGKENIKSSYNCMTRLRFTLFDESKIDMKSLSKIKGTLGAVNKGGQFQIIIGNNVTDVYKEVAKQLGIIDKSTEVNELEVSKNKGDRKFSFGYVIETVASLFGPIILVIAGAGIFQGILAIFTTTGVLKGENAKVLNMIADAGMTMLPVLLAVTAANRFKANPFIAIAVAGVLISPTMIQEKFVGTEYLHLFGIPLAILSYKGAMIPTLITIYVQSKLEYVLNKSVPKVIRALLVPMIILVIMAPIALLAFGPLGNYIGLGLAWVIGKMINFQPWLAGLIYGGLRPIIVLFGMHYAIMPVVIQNIATQGYDLLSPISFMSTAAQGGAALGCLILMRDKSQKQVASAAAISGAIGITEPTIFGLLIKFKQALLVTVLTGATCGAIVAGLNVKIYDFVMGSWLTVASYFNGENPLTNLLIAIIVSLSAYAMSATLIVLIGFDEFAFEHKSTYEGLKWYQWKKIYPIYKQNLKENKEKHIAYKARLKNSININSISKGKISDLSDSSEFSYLKFKGDKGYIITSTNGQIVSPIEGVVEKVFDSKNSLIIKNTDLNVSILIHLGMGENKITNDYFEINVKEKALVKQGESLFKFNIKELKKQELNYDTFVLVETDNSKFDVEINLDNISTKPNKKMVTIMPNN